MAEIAAWAVVVIHNPGCNLDRRTRRCQSGWRGGPGNPARDADSVMQPVVDHSHTGVVPRVDRMHQHRVTAVDARLPRLIRRRERQMATLLATDHIEGAHPIEQPDVDRCGCGGRQYGDQTDGENL